CARSYDYGYFDYW
nr:immunoglobulin heavy chain junction region [Mus musculus]